MRGKRISFGFLSGRKKKGKIPQRAAFKTETKEIYMPKQNMQTLKDTAQVPSCCASVPTSDLDEVILDFSR